MRLEMRTAGLFASVSFLIVGVGGYATTLNPLQSLLYGMAASIVLGMIGFKIGDIIAHPRGGRKKKHRAQRNHPKTPRSSAVTGEETFLEDIGS